MARRTAKRGKRRNPLYRTKSGKFTGRKTKRRVASKKRRPSKKRKTSARRRKRNPVAKRRTSRSTKRSYTRKRATSRAPARRRRPASRRRSPARRRTTRRNPVGKAIFGLPAKWTKLWGVGPLFREDVFFTGAGVSVGIGVIPMLEGQIIKATKLNEQDWYGGVAEGGGPKPAKLAIDVAGPVVVGGLVGTAAMAIKNKPMRYFAKGVALAGVGLGVGRLLDWLLWSRIDDPTKKPAPTPGPGTAGYLTAAPGVSGYLTAPAGRGMGSTYLEGGSHGSFGAGYDYGEETEIGQMYDEQRTF